MKNIHNIFLRLAVIWFVIGVAMGIGMGASQKFTLMPVHAHINLLGWVSMTLFAVFYRFWPRAAESSLAKWHFWLYVPAHLVMVITLGMEVSGKTAAAPILGLSTVVIGLGVLCFAVLAWKCTGAQATAPGVAQPAGT